MKKILFYLVISLFPAYALGQVVCPVPDMQENTIYFTTLGSEIPAVGIAEFSLDDDMVVRFATGNLLYQPKTDTWRIAPRQYDFVGGMNEDASADKDAKEDAKQFIGQNGTIWDSITNPETGKKEWTRCTNDYNHTKSYEGWIDLFTWGTSGWYGDDTGEDRTKGDSWRVSNNPNIKVTCNPYELGGRGYHNFKLGGSWDNDMTGTYAMSDWGVRNNSDLCEGKSGMLFRTPTETEFGYLVNTRTNASKLRARGRIRLAGAPNPEGGYFPDTLVNGVILLPDNWDFAIDIPGKTFKSDYAGCNRYYQNEFTENEWKVYLEGNGAIFLPAGGGNDGSKETVIKTNRSGYYWTSTVKEGSACKAVNVEFGGFSSNYYPALTSQPRKYSRTVRLVVEISTPAPEPEP